MINDIISTVIILLVVVVLAIALFFCFLWWQSQKQPLAHGLIVEKYYVCNKNKILQGGIFGKGPTRKFSDDNSQSWCWRKDWQEISRQEFKDLASKWYGMVWCGLVQRNTLLAEGLNFL